MIDRLKKLTGHNIIELTSRGNTAIFAALYLARQATLVEKKITANQVLIPDQGGWFTYKKYPKLLGLEEKHIETDKGVIKTEILKQEINKNTLCLLYSNPAGYFAEQPAEEIYDICKKQGVLVILDITGCIGNGDYGEYADILVASFGHYKPVEVGYGGLISIKDKRIYEKGKDIFCTTIFDERYKEKLEEKLDQLKHRYVFFNKLNKKIKRDLKEYDIIHKDKKGINVLVRFKDKEERERLINYCKKNDYPKMLCPMYIKVKEKAVSIEVQRMR